MNASNMKSDYYVSDDEPTAEQKRQWSAEAKEQRAKWAAEGRDAGGSLISHPSPCMCMYCAPRPLTCPLFRMACPSATVAQEKRFAAEARAFEEGSWWSLVGEEMLATEDREVAEGLATRVEREARAAALVDAFDRKNKSERVAIRVGAMCTKKSVVIQKVAQPCKFLYNCQGTPARPTSMSVTTECWSHEYIDPLTKQKIVKHVCDRLHPGEEGWCSAWDTDRNFRPANAENRFKSLGGGQPRGGQDRRRR